MQRPCDEEKICREAIRHGVRIVFRVSQKGIGKAWEVLSLTMRSIKEPIFEDLGESRIEVARGPGAPRCPQELLQLAPAPNRETLHQRRRATA